MILYKFKNWIYINLVNPFRTMNKLKGVFKPLKCYFKFNIGKWAPYPVLWVSKPSYIQIMFKDIGWKDKYDTPRFEHYPYIWIHIYKWNFVWYWDFSKSFKLANPKEYIDEYWEQALWYLHYYGNTSYGSNCPDIKKAKKSWPWNEWNEEKDSWTNSWNDKFLIKNDRIKRTIK